MADNKLNVEIGATTKGFEKGLKKAEQGLKGFEKATEKTDKKVGGLGNTTKANATPALQEFSRVIQDAPYGIQGVANNITQLTSQFGYLQKSAGGTSAALKTMVGTLAGPAGILFAVSAVTSLWVSYGGEIANVIKGNSELEASQKKVNEALNDFYGNNVAKLHSYVSILEDVNTGEDERLRITDELIKQVPTLTKADFNYGNNLDKVRAKIGDYVLAQASRIEADTLVEENAEKLAKKARIVQINSIKDQEKRVSEYRKFLESEGEKVKKTSLTATYIAGGRTRDIDKTADEITKDFNAFADNLETELAPVQERINQLYSTTFSGGKPKDDTSNSRNKLEALGMPTVEEVAKYGAQILQAFQKTFGSEGGLGVQLIDTDKALADVAKGMQVIAEGMPDATKPVLTAVEKFNLAFNELIIGGTINTLGMLGESIGVALAEGGNVLAAVGQTLLKGLSDFLGNLGGMLIEYGTLAVAKGKLDLAILAGGPVAIGAGLAAIAVGVALKAASGALGSFAGSGGETGGVAGGGRESSGYSASSRGGGGSNAGGTYVFEIAGTKLVGVLQNTLERNRSLGGTNKLTFSS